MKKHIFLLFTLIILTTTTFAQSINDQLVQAAYDGNEAKVKELLKKGAKPNSKDDNGYTALIYSCAYGYEGITKALIDAGANVKGRYNGVHPIVAAVNNDNTKTMKMLLDAGATVNCVDENGYTPLMFAAQEGYKNSINFLLIKGSNIDAETNDGHTALSIAIQNGHTDIVQRLLAYNPKKRGYSVEAHSPLNTSIHLRKTNEKQMLKNYGMKKTYGWPSFEYFFGGFGVEGATHDILFTYKAGIHEKVYNFDIIGTYVKNADSAMTLMNTDGTYYNTLLGGSLGLYKNFNIIPVKKGNWGITIGGFGSSYHGWNATLNNYDTQLFYGAGGGFYFRSNVILFKVNYNRVLRPNTMYAPDRINATLFLRLFTFKNSNSRYIYADKTLMMI